MPNDKRRRFNGSERVALYLAQDGLCANCGIELEPSWHADHEKPWSHGGPTDVVNGQALCPTCNLKKGNKESMSGMKLRKWQEEALDRYNNLNKRDFLLVATPGAGKTFFMATVAKQLIEQKECEAVLVVVPTSELCTQTADAFKKVTGIELNPHWGGDSPLVGTTFRGAVVTYSWLARNASLVVRNQMEKYSTFVILDEPHHCAHEKSWGSALKESLEPATRRLLTTGTPFRTDGYPIPFVHYDEDGKVVPDYSFAYGKALQEGGVVRSLFFRRHGGKAEWEDEKGRKEATFDDDLDEKGQSRRLRTALWVGGDHVGGLLSDGAHQLEELRQSDPDAAMLVIAIDQAHAKAIAERISKEHGIQPRIAVSEDPNADKVIKAFKKSKDPVLVTVRMVSEGVDIPRLRILVYATNVVTDLFFIQAAGRVVRIEEDHDDSTAYIYIPDDPRLRKLAKQITDEREDALRKRDEDEKKGGGGGYTESMFFQPIDATSDPKGTIVEGSEITEAELIFADAFRKKSPATATVTREVAATFIRLMKIPIPNEHNPAPDNTTTTPHYQTLPRLRDLSNSLVPRICEKYGLEYRDVHVQLNKAVKVSSVSTCDDAEKLKLRHALALRWLKEGQRPGGI